MDNFSHQTTTCTHAESPPQEPYQQVITAQDDIIDMYLNQQALYQAPLQRNSSPNHPTFQVLQQRTQNTQLQLQERLETLPIETKQRKSIFHNFQKHLITIIKKYLTITRNMVSYCQDGPVAYELWQAFMRTNSFNKRLLHAVFGVQEQKSKRGKVELSPAEFTQFEKLRLKYGNQRLSIAQKIIRKNVVDQAMHITKFLLEANSNITKFDQFYAYYSNFLNEIKMGPLSKRMKKSSKQLFMKILQCQQ